MVTERNTGGVAEGTGVGVAVGVGDGVGLGVAVACGVGVGVGNEVGDSDGFGKSTAGASVAVLVGCALGVDEGVPAGPGATQLLTFSPFAKLACNRVCPCSRMTGPSNFPRTILPL